MTDVIIDHSHARRRSFPASRSQFANVRPDAGMTFR